MDPKQEIEGFEATAVEDDSKGSISVDDFIRELEAKEKDLHITAETTVIELSEAFSDSELPDFMRGEFPDHSVVEQARPAAQPSKAKEKAAKTKLEAENRQLKEKLQKFEDERDEMLKDVRRRASDFANFKSRVDRERRESFSNQVSNLATQMLPALDNLNRAVDFAMEIPRDEQNGYVQFFDGVVLINQQVNDVLAGMGIVPIAAVGEAFDPHWHEAAAAEETDEFPPNTVCGEILRGYKLGDRVIRHSIVRVAKASADRAKPNVLEKMFEPDDDSSDAEQGDVPEAEEIATAEELPTHEEDDPPESPNLPHDKDLI